jgi:hypothetical protein
MEVHTREGHPFAWMHGPLSTVALEAAEKLGLGSRSYEFVDVFPVEKPERSAMPYIPAG